MHISSLPSDTGIGNFGRGADAFLEFLKESGFTYWQICPLGQTGFGDSPYQSFSAFAGNPYFIDLTDLGGLVEAGELEGLKKLPENKCDFASLYEDFNKILSAAASRFKQKAYVEKKLPQERKCFEEFCAKNAFWLDDYALFTALKKRFVKNWTLWDAPYRCAETARKTKLDAECLETEFCVKFTQWVFFKQFVAFKRRAEEAGISIFGDLPIFLSQDSSDVWAHAELFELDADGNPTFVAGVAPDYFSATGQLWGNPLYNWKNREAVYAFWAKRIENAFEMFDVIRLDHFRGFADYWAIPANAKDAREGSMRLGPGVDFFSFLRGKFPDGKFVAEDLGLLSATAEKLRDDIKIPSMAVLQFAFGGDAQNPYLPHNIARNMVYYTGTHDNNTSLGWYESASERERDAFRRYFRVSGREANWDMICAVLRSVARLAVIPMQDILSLGADCRFNTPGTDRGNWAWRMTYWQLELARKQNSAYLGDMLSLFGRARKHAKAKPAIDPEK